MRVAICDDERIFRDGLKALLIDYKRQHRLHIDIDLFDSGDALLQSDLAYDLVFLDYQMPGLNGLDAARQLRQRRVMCRIVFVTAFPSFIRDSFEVQPFRFFFKPITATDVDAMMTAFIRQLKLLAPLVIVENGEQHIIPSSEILYAEGAGKYSVIRTATATYSCSKTLAQVHALLPQHCFYRVHKSYVVNLYAVDRLAEREILLTNGERVLLARGRTGSFHRDFMSFVKNYYVKV